jgi:hypothetical protein
LKTARRILTRVAIAGLVLAALSWLFLKTVRDTNAEPYEVDREELSGWMLGLDDPAAGSQALLVLRPPVQLSGDLFQQIFHRTGVSLAGPARPGMPIVLASEYAAGLKAAVTPEELLNMAREAGFEREPMMPRCMGITKDPLSGRSSQRFFVVFESGPFTRLRSELARLRETRGTEGRFDPAGLIPLLPVASFEADFQRWWPLQVDIEGDCQTPIVVRTP